MDSLPNKEVKSFNDFMLDQYQRSEIGKTNKSKHFTMPKGGVMPLSDVKTIAGTLNTLNIAFANDSISTQNGFKHYKFDIIANANIANTYFSNAIIQLSYNSFAFGLNL